MSGKIELTLPKLVAIIVIAGVVGRWPKQSLVVAQAVSMAIAQQQEERRRKAIEAAQELTKMTKVPDGRRTGGVWARHHAPVLNLQRHRPAVPVTCSEGHTFKVQARPGSDVKCAVCWQQRGEENWLTVPRAP